MLQHKLSEENSYHVKYLEIEMSKDKLVSVMIDSDSSNIVDNVIRYGRYHVSVFLSTAFGSSLLDY